MSYIDVTGMGQVQQRIPVRPGARARTIRVPRLMRGLGQAATSAPLLVQPGPGGVGTQIVDPNGNIVYSAAQVAANPNLLNQVNSSLCTPPMVPTYFPGGQSECSMPGTITTQIAGNPTITCDDPSGLCYGSTYEGETITSPQQIANIPTALPSAYTSSTAIAPTPAGMPSVAAAAVSQAVIPTSASLLNTSRPSASSFQVGDSWTLTITGAPNSPVTDAASQNGQSLGTTPYGSTDGNGNFSLSGTIGSGQIGTWSETWAVGGVAAPTLNFTIVAGPSGGAPAPAIATTPQQVTTPITSVAAAQSAQGNCFSLFSSLGIPDPCLGPIGLTTLAAGVLAVIILGSMFGGGRR